MTTTQDVRASHFAAPTHAESDIFNQFGYDYTPDTVKSGRKAAAEFLAMTLFVWIGCGAVVSTQAFVVFDPDSGLDNTFLTAVPLAFGLAISVLAYSIAPISGGHINPAVTFAFVLLGDMTPMVGVIYVTAQCLGAILGAAILWGCTASERLMEYTYEATEDGGGVGEHPPFLLGINEVNPNVPVASAFLIEFMGTFLLVWTVLMTAVNVNSIAGNLAPIAIGWSVFLAHVVLIPFTGCGINPARSLGPMLVVIMSGKKVSYDGWWVFYTAPFVGAAAAAMVCKYIFNVKPTSDDVPAVNGGGDGGFSAVSSEKKDLTAEEEAEVEKKE